jgi:hypothetical protein
MWMWVVGCGFRGNPCRLLQSHDRGLLIVLVFGSLAMVVKGTCVLFYCSLGLMGEEGNER